MNCSKFQTTILHVDDEGLSLKYFLRAAGSGFDVLDAESAEEALVLLKENQDRIGVVVADYRMPGMNGAELLREVAREYPHIVCVLITGFSDRNVLFDSINTGEVFRVIEKPLYAPQVAEILCQATGLAQDRALRRQRLMAMDDAVSFLAHELTTPLAAIAGYGDSVGQRFADSRFKPLNLQEIERAVAAMHNNAGYCLEVLSTCVTSIRNEGKLLTAASCCSARELVASLLNALPLTPAQRQAVKLDVSEDFPIRCMPNLVSLVLACLLQNALKGLQDHAAPAICVTVLVERRPQIRIADNGSGIAPGVLEWLRAEQAASGISGISGGGEGWNLVFCSRMMRTFGGHLSFESERGAGTMITLEFPAATAGFGIKGAIDDGPQ